MKGAAGIAILVSLFGESPVVTTTEGARTLRGLNMADICSLLDSFPILVNNNYSIVCALVSCELPTTTF